MRRVERTLTPAQVTACLDTLGADRLRALVEKLGLVTLAPGDEAEVASGARFEAAVGIASAIGQRSTRHGAGGRIARFAGEALAANGERWSEARGPLTIGRADLSSAPLLRRGLRLR